MLYVILIIAKALFYVMLIIATSLLYAIYFMIKIIGSWLKIIGSWLKIMVVIFSVFMWKLSGSLFVKIKNTSVEYVVKKPLQNQSKLYQLIVPIVFLLLLVWIFAYSLPAEEIGIHDSPSTIYHPPSTHTLDV